MVSIKIYIEGGGDGKDLDSRFREAWTKFFKAAGLQGKMPRQVRGKGRKNAYDLFCTAIQNAKSDELPLLLVDSEDTVAGDHTAWQHLKTRDRWDKPVKADDQHVYLMTQLMETWLLADPTTLQAYFGKDFKSDKIPNWPDFEAVPKQTVLDILDKATSSKYAKGKVSFEVLSKTSPQIVAEKCPHAKKFLDFLKER
ncbi:MAG: DUF4276 family protein [Saprospiraceae bacterium]|nr:DUF4276 family protein [Saprospiraceae bacterium]